MENLLKDKSYAIEFSGPAQQILYSQYGNPCKKGWGALWLVDWKVKSSFDWFPLEKICIHKDFVPRLHNAFTQLESLNLHYEIKSCDEAYCIRFINSSTSVLSAHSWGAAIDLNAEDNPLGSSGRWSFEFIDVMHENGVFCGQSWIGRKDPMHFCMVNG